MDSNSSRASIATQWMPANILFRIRPESFVKRRRRSPVLAQGNALGSKQQRTFRTLKGFYESHTPGLIPNVTLVVFDLILLQERAELILKRLSPMMFFLRHDVALDLGNM